MWPAIVTGFIAAIALLGLISQRNPLLYSKTINHSKMVACIVSVATLGFYVGVSEGIDSVLEYLNSTLVNKVVGTQDLYELKPSMRWLILSITSPIYVPSILIFIRYIAVNIKKADSTDN